jgi:hypothetical protein
MSSCATSGHPKPLEYAILIGREVIFAGRVIP